MFHFKALTKSYIFKLEKKKKKKLGAMGMGPA